MHAIGLDIGGSKTHAVSYLSTAPAGTQHAESYAASANLASVGVAEARAQLEAALAALAAQGHDGAPDVVCAGAAGVDSPAAEQRLRTLLASLLPETRVLVVHDTHLVLAAAGVRSGIAVISGTGSVAWGRTAQGRTARAGGWGYLLGDEGSGYGIARDAVRHALSRADCGLCPDALTTQLLANCGLVQPAQLLDHFYARPERRYWARQSVTVFALAAGGDLAALELVADAARSLAAVVQRVHTVLGRAPGMPVVLGGGILVNQPALRKALRGHLAAGSLTDLRVLDRHPAQGALELALESTTQPVGDSR